MTFTGYFGLNNNPFDMANEASALPFGTNKEDVCQLMLHDLRDGCSVVILTGESGSGKTQLLRRLSTLLPPDMLPITPIDSCMNYMERVQMAVELQGADTYGAKKLLLVADNAESIPDADLKRLLAFPLQYENTGKSFQMIWCGTPALDAKLNNIDPTKFNSLYPHYYHLVGLSEPQVKGYVDECLRRGGYSAARQGEIFSSAAIHEIARLSKGLPRLINQLCSASLTLAFLDHEPQVNGQLALEAALFTLFRADRVSGITGPNNLISAQDILRTSPHKLSLQYIQRWARFYWLKAVSPSHNKTQKKQFFADKPLKVYAGGIAALGFCLILLGNFWTVGTKDTAPDMANNADTFVETLPATSAGNSPPIEASLDQTGGNEAPAVAAMGQNVGLSKNTKPPLQGKLGTAPSPADIARIGMPTAQNAPASKSQPESKTAMGKPQVASHKRADPTVLAQKAQKQALPKGNDNPASSNRHSVAHVHSAKMPVSKAIAEPKPEFVLMPLDAPGKWDEIVILEDPKAPNSNPPMSSGNPTVLTPEEDKIPKSRHKNTKHRPQAQFVLKPLDAPGKWDEIVIVDDPKADPKKVDGAENRNGAVLAPGNRQNTAGEPAVISPSASSPAPDPKVRSQQSIPSNKEGGLLRLDKSNYQYIEQIDGTDDPQPTQQPQKKDQGAH